MTARIWMFRIFVAALIALALFLTDARYSMLEDETSIVQLAQAPVVNTLSAFTHGVGQHEHPPLSDLVLHYWLPMAGVSPSLVRLPFMFCYALALLIIAATAEELVGGVAFKATLLVGALWPFGFHFGRMAGWYTVCFLLIAALTYCYLRFIQSPSWGRFALVMMFAYAAVLTNYFSWTVVALIGVDLLFSMRARGLKFVVPGLAILVVGYGPIWRAFLGEALHHPEGGHSLMQRFLLGGFSFYSIFVSESVAPWIFKFSVFAALAIAAALVCVFRLSSGPVRRIFVGFFVLYILLVLLGVVNTKRLLFISGWLLIAIGCALGQPVRLRRYLAAALAVCFAIGWFGIVARRYYSAPHFIEPWNQVARDSAAEMQHGALVISNSPSFLFYLNSEMYKDGLSSEKRAHWAAGPQVASLAQPGAALGAWHGEIEFVEGVNTTPETQERVVEAGSWLTSHCELISTHKMTEDNGAALREKFFHHPMVDDYRIHVMTFRCP